MQDVKTKSVTFAQIDRFIVKVGKKRDEVRKLLDEISPTVESLESADEEFGLTLRLLGEAKDALETAADQMSLYA